MHLKRICLHVAPWDDPALFAGRGRHWPSRRCGAVQKDGAVAEISRSSAVLGAPMWGGEVASWTSKMPAFPTWVPARVFGRAFLPTGFETPDDDQRVVSSKRRRLGETVVLLCRGRQGQPATGHRTRQLCGDGQEVGMPETFTKWDGAEHLGTKEDARLYLEASAEEDPGDGSLISAALNDIARARNKSLLARDAGMSREGLHKALSENGNPSFATVMRITRALGMQLRFTV